MLDLNFYLKKLLSKFNNVFNDEIFVGENKFRGCFVGIWVCFSEDDKFLLNHVDEIY